jgi:formylglycine-generating enzyme required for sulfatase activity
MDNWKISALAAVTVTVAGLAYINVPRGHIPPDLRDAPADTAQDSNRTGAENASKGFLTGLLPGAPAETIEWVTIPGGKFMMGTNETGEDFKNARPIHEVDIKTFDISRTMVTVEQYQECVDQKQCTEPGSDPTGNYVSCNWKKAGHRQYPVNCVNWDQAGRYAKFKKARLPSEAEWEYAARSGGKDQRYPWGDSRPACDSAMVAYGADGRVCDEIRFTDAVCSKPAMNTKIAGLPADKQLCDMTGHVRQWVQDKYQKSYDGAPVDGGAFEDAGHLRVFRGGSLGSAAYLRADFRDGVVPGYRSSSIGFRLAR